MIESNASQTSTSLLRGARANDQAAWQRLVHEYGRRVYRWCRLAGLQSADASNVVQEVLRSVAKSLPSFRREQDGDSFRGWIYRITQNKLRDHYRSLRHVVTSVGGTDAHRALSMIPDPFGKSLAIGMPGDGDSSSFDNNVSPAPALDAKEIERLQMEFSKRDWQMFWRVVVGGQPAVEVAHEFGVTGNAVRLVKMRVLRRLREIMSPS